MKINMYVFCAFMCVCKCLRACVLCVCMCGVAYVCACVVRVRASVRVYVCINIVVLLVVETFKTTKIHKHVLINMHYKVLSEHVDHNDLFSNAVDCLHFS